MLYPGGVQMYNPMNYMPQLNPAVIQEQYRKQYPHLNNEQIIQATRAYIQNQRTIAYQKMQNQQNVMNGARQNTYNQYNNRMTTVNSVNQTNSNVYRQQVYNQQQATASKDGWPTELNGV